jgi:tyrosyl-tRNA synthetase
MRLAREIVSIFHSPEAAEESQRRWDEVFRGGSGVPDDIPEESLAEEERVTDILRRLGMVGSGAEARRLIEQNGVRIDGQPVTDVMATITPNTLPLVLQVGKRKFVRLVSAM